MQETNMKRIKTGIVIGLIMISLVTVVFAAETALTPVDPDTRSSSLSGVDYGSRSNNVITDETLYPIKTASFTHNQTIWASSGAVQVQEQFTNVPFKNHYVNEYSVSINKSSLIYADTHFTHPYFIDGVRPKVRYVWSRMQLDKGINVTYIYVCSGYTIVKGKQILYVGNGAMMDYMFDMGAWYDMPRGIEIGYEIQNNNSTTTKMARFYGSGARIEW
jgi:hypothetical protein